MNWKNKNVLVTGADHFISIHLIERLVKLGCNVKAFVRHDYHNSIGSMENIPAYIRKRIQVIFGSLTNPDIIECAVKDTDIVFHFGILDVIPYDAINIRSYLEGNIIGTFNLLNSAKNYKIERIIHISTAEVYGNVKDIPIGESNTLKALSPQIGCDIGAEKLVEGYYNSCNLPLTIIRLFNTYGPIQSLKAIVPTIITQVLKEPKLLLGDMHAVRDFVYVEDIVDGLIKAVEVPESVGTALNLGSGNGISIGDLADIIVNIVGREVEVIFDATRIRIKTPTLDQMIADITKAKELLGWQPKTSLNAGLEKTIEWFAEHIETSQV
jgi:nucleoside-diphosphate-sugar epimerase